MTTVRNAVDRQQPSYNMTSRPATAAASASSEWRSAAQLLEEFAAEEALQQGSKPRRQISNLKPVRETYRYDPSYEYEAPKWCDFQLVGTDSSTPRSTASWFVNVHPLHESADIPPPPEVLYSEPADFSPLSSKHRTKLLSPIGKARKITAQLSDEEEDEEFAALFQSQPQQSTAITAKAAKAKRVTTDETRKHPTASTARLNQAVKARQPPTTKSRRSVNRGNNAPAVNVTRRGVDKVTISDLVDDNDDAVTNHSADDNVTVIAPVKGVEQLELDDEIEALMRETAPVTQKVKPKSISGLLSHAQRVVPVAAQAADGDTRKAGVVNDTAASPTITQQPAPTAALQSTKAVQPTVQKTRVELRFTAATSKPKSVTNKVPAVTAASAKRAPSTTTASRALKQQ